MSGVLLLSGGLDSTAVAAWLRPSHCLGIDYGQRSAQAEHRAGSAVAHELDLRYSHVRVDATAVGGGLMIGKSNTLTNAAEWWPYRNQLLITIAAGWGVVHGHDEILLGTVEGDGSRHADGRQPFFDAMSTVLQSQEGNLSVRAPAIKMSAPDLLRRSGVSDSILGWTHSCHSADLPCGQCPGCIKRAEVLGARGREHQG